MAPNMTMMKNSDIINCFPGYEFIPRSGSEDAKNMYRGVDLGFGGYVVGEPGVYTNVALIDAASMHPTSVILLNKLGEYTQRYANLRAARVFIKHHDYESAGKLFEGKLTKYLTNDEDADALSTALKYPLNAFYGISTAKYDNPARDSRDMNNIIALRGALFMKTLKDEVEKYGFKVISIKTDSCKIPDATPEIIQFVIDFGKKYGYEMEHEATYEKLCLVNKAVYIARYDDKGIRNKGGKKARQWDAVGTQFQIPYVFKTLFSHEPITFKDKCETKKVKSKLYLDFNENLPEGEHDYHFVGRVGQFCPIKPGCGGGLLVKTGTANKDKYDAVTGTKGYRWMESVTIRGTEKEADIDESYYRALCDEAIRDIDEYCKKAGKSYEWFVSDDPIPPVESRPLEEPLPDFMNIPETDEEELPWAL